MKKQLFSLLILLTLFASPLMAQEAIPPATVKNIEKVFAHASAGYDELNAWELLIAAKILINNPKIQDFKMPSSNTKDTLEEDEFYKDFFDPEKILVDASKMTPIDAKLLKFTISKFK